MVNAMRPAIMGCGTFTTALRGPCTYLMCSCVYITLAVALLTFYLAWAVALWLLIMLIIVAAALAALVGGVLACLGDGGGGGCEGDCPKCDCCDGGAGGGDACCGDCGGCCDNGYAGDVWLYNSTSTDVMFWGNSNDGCCKCECPKCTAICLIFKPLAWLIHKLPMWPPNAWGGIIGYWIFETDWKRAENGLSLYQAGDRDSLWHLFVNKLGRLRYHDPEYYHREDAWRQRVHRFLMQDFIGASDAASGFPTQQTMVAGRSRVNHPPAFNTAQDSGLQYANGQAYQLIGGPRGRKIALIDTAKPFDKEAQFIAESSFEDYKKGDCWICMCKEERFHLWTNCGHIFGEGCSSEMIRRGMPCPLCREISPVVKIGDKYCRNAATYNPPSFPVET